MHASIDLAICILSGFLDFNWKVGKDICGSNHFSIFLKSKMNRAQTQNFIIHHAVNSVALSVMKIWLRHFFPKSLMKLNTQSLLGHMQSIDRYIKIINNKVIINIYYANKRLMLT